MLEGESWKQKWLREDKKGDDDDDVDDDNFHDEKLEGNHSRNRRFS